MMRVRSQFFGDKRGIAAVEFALIAPVLIAMLFGIVEVCNALVCREKVTAVSASIADIVTQEATVSQAEIDNIFSTVNSLVYPYPQAGITIVVSSIVEKVKGVPGMYVVDWSSAQNGAPRAKGSSISVPEGLVTQGGSVVLAEVSYTYNSSTSHYITGPIAMTDSFYARPRRSTEVLYTP